MISRVTMRGFILVSYFPGTGYASKAFAYARPGRLFCPTSHRKLAAWTKLIEKNVVHHRFLPDTGFCFENDAPHEQAERHESFTLGGKMHTAVVNR